MKLEDWQEQERKKRGIIAPTGTFFGRENEMAELRAFLEDETVRIFALYGVPMIGKTTLVREFLKTVTKHEIHNVQFQNPENPENTLSKQLPVLDWNALAPKLIVIENFEETLKLRGDHDHLHGIRLQKIRQFIEDKARLPHIKLILVSRFQIKMDFLPGTAHRELSNKQLGGVDRKELFSHLNRLYRNNTVSYEAFDKLCQKFNDHIWLIEMAMQAEWDFENVLEAVQHPETITQKLWGKLQKIIKQLPSPEKTLLCAFAIVNPITEIDLEQQIKTLPGFQKQGQLEDALWSLRKKLLAVYNVLNESYELNPFLREVCFTFLQYQKEMKALEELPYFTKVQKPKYDPVRQAQEKGDYTTFFRLLKEKRKAGKHKEVIEILQEDYWVNPKKVAVLNEIAITYKWQKKYDKAIEALTKALKIEPDNVKVLNELAITYKEQTKYDKAIEALTKALKVEPDNIKVLNELAIIYKEQKKYDEAIEILKRALEINNEDVKTLNELAIIYKEQKKYNEAIKTLTKALKIEPDDVKLLNELAIIYKEQKKYDEAMQIFRELIDKYQHLPSYNELANIYRKLGNFEKALITVQMGLKIAPANGYFRSTLSRIKHLQERAILENTHNEEILNQKKTLVKELQESLHNFNNLKATLDENVSKKIKKTKFLTCLYFVGVWLLTITLDRIFGWSIFEEWTFIIGFSLTIGGIIYLIIMNEELDIRKYMGKLHDKYYEEESQKLSYSEEKLNSLYKNISSLEEEIKQLEIKDKASPSV